MKAVFRLFYYISILLTCVLAGVTFIGCLAGYISPYECMFASFVALFLPTLLLLNMGAVLYWAIRWRFWVFLPLLAVVANWGFLTRVIQLSNTASDLYVQTDSTASANYTQLVVATYNVDRFGSDHVARSCKEIASYMKTQEVDVMCFQEFGGNSDFTVDSIRTTLSEWTYSYIPIGSPDKDPLLQLAIFSRYPIRAQQLVTYPDSKNCSLWCDIDINGQVVRLFNNHLQTTAVSHNRRELEREFKIESGQGICRALSTLISGLRDNFKKRSVQANYLRHMVDVSPHPTLVCGDLNSLPSSYTYRQIIGTKLLDGFQTCGKGYMHTYRYLKRLLRIDYIFHTADFIGLEYFSPELEHSDHKPVLMRMKI